VSTTILDSVDTRASKIPLPPCSSSHPGPAPPGSPVAPAINLSHNYELDLPGQRPKGIAGYLHVIGTACQSQLLLFYSESTNPPPKLNQHLLFHVSILLFRTQSRPWPIYLAYGGSTFIGHRMTQTTLSLLTHLSLHHIMIMYPKTLGTLNQTRKSHQNQHSQMPQSIFCFIGKIQAVAQSPMQR
jgi:hypothetical protein